MNQLDQGQGCYLSLVSKGDATTVVAGLNLSDSQSLCLDPDHCLAKQVLDLFGEQPEAIDHFHLYLTQCFQTVCCSNAFVQHQSRGDIGQIVVRYEGRDVQFYLGAIIEWAVDIGNLPALERPDSAVQHFQIQPKTHAVDLTRLLITQQFTGAPYLQIMGRKQIAGPQFPGRFDSIQPLFCVAGHRRAGWAQQVGVGLVM